MVDATFMAEARTRDVAVNVWTGPDESQQRFALLVDLGVDGIITSAPDVALAVIRGL
jgi:glycerophosphoryl diester phosphodiesterase